VARWRPSRRISATLIPRKKFAYARRTLSATRVSPAQELFSDVVSDLAEVFRLGTAKAKENLAFRRYLSARHYANEPFQILACEVQQHVDCTACANRCRHSVVSVNEQEVDSIARHLGATPEAIARLYTAPDPDAPGSRTLLNSAEECVFLNGNLCMIYEARPKTCRDFPHIAVGTHSLGARPSSLARRAALCPIIYNALESYKHLTGYDKHPSIRTTCRPPT
jgi:Fe-S-cluster containining protein